MCGNARVGTELRLQTGRPARRVWVTCVALRAGAVSVAVAVAQNDGRLQMLRVRRRRGGHSVVDLLDGAWMPGQSRSREDGVSRWHCAGRRPSFRLLTHVLAVLRVIHAVARSCYVFCGALSPLQLATVQSSLCRCY